MIWLYVFIFLASCFLLAYSGGFLVGSLMKIGRFLGWREFVVAFFVMALAGAAPNLFVGIDSALHQIPQLSLGDVVGGNVIDFTLAVALAILISGATLPADSRMVQSSTVFTAAIAILPLILLLDGKLGRGDGIILILTFVFYVFWLFSKEERFKKVYDNTKSKEKKIAKRFERFKIFMRDVGRMLLALVLLIVAAEGVVRSAVFFAESLSLPVGIIGILIVGLGNALPETYFAIVSARRGQTWMILGNLISNIIVPATLVLGIVSLISPIKIVDFSPFALARFFLIISAIFFLIVIRSDKKITKKEAVFLLFVYLLFVSIEILNS